jgi:hypothetical protein
MNKIFHVFGFKFTEITFPDVIGKQSINKYLFEPLAVNIILAYFHVYIYSSLMDGSTK